MLPAGAMRLARQTKNHVRNPSGAVDGSHQCNQDRVEFGQDGSGRVIVLHQVAGPVKTVARLQGALQPSKQGAVQLGAGLIAGGLGDLSSDVRPAPRLRQQLDGADVVIEPFVHRQGACAVGSREDDVLALIAPLRPGAR